MEHAYEDFPAAAPTPNSQQQFSISRVVMAGPLVVDQRWLTVINWQAHVI